MTFRLESTGQLPPDRGTAAPDPYPGATWAPRSLAARYRQSPRPTLVRMWKEHSPKISTYVQWIGLRENLYTGKHGFYHQI